MTTTTTTTTTNAAGKASLLATVPGPGAHNSRTPADLSPISNVEGIR